MKKKILSLLTAFAMVFGILVAPFTTASANNGSTPPPELPAGKIEEGAVSLTKPDSTKLYVHKLQANSYNNNVPAKHNGGKLDLTTPGPGPTQTNNIIGTDVKPLDGVKFKYFKIDDEAKFRNMVDNSGSYKTEAQVKAYVGDITGIEGITKSVGGDKGVLTVGGAVLNLPEGNYWFIETGYDKAQAGTDAPDNISSYIAVPFGITLPLTNTVEVTKDNKTYQPGTVWLSEVHTYPKNVTGKESIPKKTVGNEVNMNETHDVGDVQTWYLQATIPANIKDYEVFEMHDVFFRGLTYKGDVSVYMGYDGGATKVNLTAGTDYTLTQPAVDYQFKTPIPADIKADVTPTDNSDLIQVKLTAEGIAKLAANYETVKTAADKSTADDKEVKVYAKVDTVINEKAKISVKIPNTYDLITQIKGKDQKKKKPNDTPDVKTGGKKFKKIDKTANNKALEDAVFTIKHQKDGTKPTDSTAWNGVKELKWTQALLDANKDGIGAGKFAIKSATKEEYTATSASSAPAVESIIYVRSGGDGLFEIKGLEYSEYTITKWDANQNKFVPSTKVNNYYALKEVKAPKDYALQDKEIEFTINDQSYYQDPTQTTLVNANPLEIDNKLLTIPQTGGIGSLIFIVAGAAIMGFAFVAYRKSQAKEA